MAMSVADWLREKREFKQQMDEAGEDVEPTSFLEYQVWKLRSLLEQVTYFQDAPQDSGLFKPKRLPTHLMAAGAAVLGAWDK